MEKRCENCKYLESSYYSTYCMYCNRLTHSNWKPKEEEMEKEFTKDMLENRMVVEYRNGARRMVVDNLLIGENTYNGIGYYNNDLTSKNFKDHDIVKVYGKVNDFNHVVIIDPSDLHLLWERKETKELTLKEIAEKFGVDEVKIIDD